MLDVDSFLKEEAASWAALRSTFDRIATKDFSVAGAEGEWTPRDVLVHVACWHRYMADKLNEFAGGFAKLVPFTQEDVDSKNAEFIGRFSDWPVEAALVLARDAHTRAVVAIRASSFRPYDEEWEGMIRANTTKHYEEHIPSLEAFIKEHS